MIIPTIDVVFVMTWTELPRLGLKERDQEIAQLVYAFYGRAAKEIALLVEAATIR